VKKTTSAFLLLLSFGVAAQTVYHTRTFDKNIKTLQCMVNGDKFALPVINLKGSDVLNISFDEMSHSIRSYSYRVVQCNADWTVSDLTPGEYIDGFTNESVTDYALSVNTTYLYTHYRFSLPNDAVKMTVSGNYAVLIYEDNKQDDPVAQLCFSVVDPKVSVTANVRGNTDTELSGRLQQLDFDVLLNGFTVRDPNSELKILVRQNNRTDNEVTGITPTYINGNKLSYINNRQLIFEGGYEYRRFDFSSIYNSALGISGVKVNSPYYDIYLYDDKFLPVKSYMQSFDANGRYVINYQEYMNDITTEADYMNVHFAVPVQAPFFDGQVYLGGDLCFNLLDENSRMKYDPVNNLYYNTLLLKQGGYNYQYWFVQKGMQRASVDRTEGSFWQTGNEYTIYIYDRPWGARYDQLIGVKDL